MQILIIIHMEAPVPDTLVWLHLHMVLLYFLVLMPVMTVPVVLAKL